jgi:hypothetical protein
MAHAKCGVNMTIYMSMYWMKSIQRLMKLKWRIYMSTHRVNNIYRVNTENVHFNTAGGDQVTMVNICADAGE